jgi:hypothetical protein
VEDEYNVNYFRDLDEEISELIKPEPRSSEASFGLYSSPPEPRTQSKHSLSTAETRANAGSSCRNRAKVEQAPRIGARARVTMGLADATRHLSRNSHQDYRWISRRQRRDASQPVSQKHCDTDPNVYSQRVKDSKKIDVYRNRTNE